MSHPTDPTRPAPRSPRVFGWRGRALGLDFDVGVRITDLSEPRTEPARPPLLAGPRRAALPGTPGGAEASALDGIGRWESEGGR